MAGQDRDERAHRIMDAAVDSMLRWGYDKTTVDDVARGAAVAKGTVYLHYRNRDELFAATLRRERLRLLVAVRERLAANADGASLRLLLVGAGLAYQRHPLLTALLVRDRDLLGKLARQREASGPEPASGNDFVRYLTVLRDEGLIRTDRPMSQLVNLVSAVFYGYFTTAELVPRRYRLEPEQRAELLAETICRALDRGTALRSAERRRMAAVTMNYLDDAVAEAEATFLHGGAAAAQTEQERVR